MKKRVWNLAMKMKMTKRGEIAMESNSKIKNMVLKK